MSDELIPGTLVSFVGQTGKTREGYIVGRIPDAYLVETKWEVRPVPVAAVTVVKPPENPTVAEMLRDGDDVLFFGQTGKIREGKVRGFIGDAYIVQTRWELRPVPMAHCTPGLVLG